MNYLISQVPHGMVYNVVSVVACHTFIRQKKIGVESRAASTCPRNSV